MNSWQTKKLGDVSKIYDGTHQTPTYVENGVPFYSVEQVTANDFSRTKFITEEVFEKESKRVCIEKGDILMTRIGDIGTARYVDWDVRASFYVSLALIKCNNQVDAKFLAQAINSYKFQKELWKRSLTVAFPYKINLGDIGKSELLAPSKPEQRRIVAVLEVWDEYLELLDRKIALKEQLKKGLMQQLLTGNKRLPGFDGEWITVSLSKIGYARTSSVDKLSVDGEQSVKLLNYMDVYRRDRISNADTFQVVTAKDAQIATSNLKKGDVLFTPSSETPTDIGHSAVVIEDLPMTVFSYHLMRFRMKGSYLSVNFAAYCFKAKAFYKELWKRAQGATRFTLSKEALESAKITIPVDVDEQNAIASIIEAADGEIEAMRLILHEIKFQKKYLLKNLISGTIRTPENLPIKGAN